MRIKKSLRDRIKAAKTPAGLMRLLKEGQSYEFASFKTRVRWQEAAEKRAMEMTAKSAAVEVTE